MESVLLRLPSGQLWRCSPDTIRRAYWDEGAFYVRGYELHIYDVFHGEDAEEVSKYVAGLGDDITGQRKATEQEQEMERLRQDRSRLLQQSYKYCSQHAAIRQWLDEEGVQTHRNGCRLGLLDRIKVLHLNHLRSRSETTMNMREQLEQSQDEHLALAKVVGEVLKYLNGQQVPTLGHFGRELTLLERVKMFAEQIQGRREEDDKLLRAVRAFQKWVKGLRGDDYHLVLFSDESGRLEENYTDRFILSFCGPEDLIQQFEKD